MTDSDANQQNQILKTDSRGRVLTTRKQRESILDAYESSGLSGPEFSRVHGINYHTFATWCQKRNRARKGSVAGTTAAAAQSITLVEAVAAERPSATVSVDLPGGCRVQIDSHQQLRLVAGLLAELATATGGKSC